MQIRGLCGRSASSTAQLAERHSIPFSCDSVAALAAHPSIDLVSIVTPPATHCAHVCATLDAGKHVLAEKPFAMSVQEAREMQRAHEAACARYQRRLIAIIDHELRFHSSVRSVKAFILSGAFGCIRKVQLAFYGAMPNVLADEWSWWSDRAQFGGVLGAVGSHYIDLVSFLTSTEVVSVLARCETMIGEKRDGAANGAMRRVTSDDSTEMFTRHRSHAESPRASYRGSAAHPQEFTATTTLVSAAFGYQRNELVLLSNKGAIVCDIATMQFTFTPADRHHPKGPDTTATASATATNGGDVGGIQVWASDAPKEVRGASINSPFVRATVLVGEQLVRAVEECRAADKATATTAATDADAGATSRLTDLPPALVGIAATFADGVYIQTVLDMARESNADGCVWKECKVDS